MWHAFIIIIQLVLFLYTTNILIELCIYMFYFWLSVRKNQIIKVFYNSVSAIDTTLTETLPLVKGPEMSTMDDKEKTGIK